jgi:hypothetical protein
MARTPTTATIVDGRMLHIRFNSQALEKYRRILQTTPTPQLQSSNLMSTDPESDDDDDDDDDDDGDGDGDAFDDSGLDLNKTYSTYETLRHPCVEFVHRGQGRYRMVAGVKNNSPATLPRPTRYQFPSPLR